jgi:hypothetical protein
VAFLSTDIIYCDKLIFIGKYKLLNISAAVLRSEESIVGFSGKLYLLPNNHGKMFSGGS